MSYQQPLLSSSGGDPDQPFQTPDQRREAVQRLLRETDFSGERPQDVGFYSPATNNPQLLPSDRDGAYGPRGANITTSIPLSSPSDRQMQQQLQQAEQYSFDATGHSVLRPLHGHGGNGQYQQVPLPPGTAAGGIPPRISRLGEDNSSKTTMMRESHSRTPQRTPQPQSMEGPFYGSSPRDFYGNSTGAMRRAAGVGGEDSSSPFTGAESPSRGKRRGGGGNGSGGGLGLAALNYEASGQNSSHVLRFDAGAHPKAAPTMVRREEVGREGEWNRRRSPSRSPHNQRHPSATSRSLQNVPETHGDKEGDGADNLLDEGQGAEENQRSVSKNQQQQQQQHQPQLTQRRNRKPVHHAGAKIVRELDFDQLKHDPEQDRLQNIWGARAETLSSSYSLFSAVSTMMITATNIRIETDQETRSNVGLETIETLTGIMTYACLPFFILMAFKWNNYFAERLYYKFLKRGVIVDFPLADYRVWFKKIESMLFLIYCILFLIYSFSVMILVKASLGHILIFINNFGIGVGLYWYDQQSIELRFISLTRYIETFKDADGEYWNIDPTSLHSASRAIDNLRLAECPEPSYTHYMRGEFYRIKGAGSGEKIRDMALLYVVIALIAGLSIIYVWYLGRLNTGTRWTDSINPCTRACVLQSNGFTVQTDQSRCSMCMCRCLSYLNQLGARDECSASDGGLDINIGCNKTATCGADCTALNALNFIG